MGSAVAQPDELPPHFAAEIARVVLAVGLDNDAHRSVQRAEAHAGRRSASPHADDADGETRAPGGRDDPLRGRNP